MPLSPISTLLLRSLFPVKDPVMVAMVVVPQLLINISTITPSLMKPVPITKPEAGITELTAPNSLSAEIATPIPAASTNPNTTSTPFLSTELSRVRMKSSMSSIKEVPLPAILMPLCSTITLEESLLLMLPGASITLSLSLDTVKRTANPSGLSETHGVPIGVRTVSSESIEAIIPLVSKILALGLSLRTPGPMVSRIRQKIFWIANKRL
mmetsp:Transcript_36833/g.33065  ORF Transcript_36833/g.33065 Transcript_36833/m.33065 type:complete len:210 (+) Transcript_36833:315-944(+)